MFYRVFEYLLTTSAGGSCKGQAAVRGWTLNGRVKTLRYRFEEQGFEITQVKTRSRLTGKWGIVWP